MNIKIEIPALTLVAEAITSLAKAVAQHGKLEVNSSTQIVGGVAVVETKSTPQVVVEPTTETTEANEKPDPSPAEKKKKKLSEQIIALGGTPPEKGPVSKFEKALAELEATNEAEPNPVGEADTPEEQTEAEPNIDDITADEETQVKAPTLAEVRMLAVIVLKATTGKDGEENEDLGKTKLRACLKTVGAASLSDATPEQLTKIVPLLENCAGVKLADAVAKTTA